METASPQKFDPQLSALIDALNGKFQISEINGQEQPIFLAVAFPLIQGITGLKPRLPAGRGFTKSHAMLGAAAEAAELLSSLACKETRQIHSIKSKESVDFITAIDMATGVEIDVEAQSVFLDYAKVFNQTLKVDVDSTGCACAETLAEATSRGLLECIERDALAIWWYGRQSRSHVLLSFIDQIHPRLSYWLNRRARVTLAIDITSHIGVPATVAFSSERDGTSVAVGSAAHPNFETATINAISEMIQMETSMRLSAEAENPELKRWLSVASTLRMPQFQPIQSGSAPLAKTEKNVLECVTDAGFRALAVDLSLKGFPVACARVVVPGLSGLRLLKNENRILAQAHKDTRNTFPSKLETIDIY